MGKISSLPTIIIAVKTILDKGENIAKFPVGPTIPSPGPMLPSVAATAVKLVVKSKLSRLIITRAPAKIRIYATKKTFMPLNVSCSRTLPLNLTLIVLLGWVNIFISFIILLHKSVILETFIPPPVLPVHAPQNIRSTKIVFENCGHISKFVVA